MRVDAEDLGPDVLWLVGEQLLARRLRDTGGAAGAPRGRVPVGDDVEHPVDGVVVEQRRFRRTTGGAGTVTYQFVVPASAATADGVVRVRFQDVDTDHDPSIADLWATKLP